MLQACAQPGEALAATHRVQQGIDEVMEVRGQKGVGALIGLLEAHGQLPKRIADLLCNVRLIIEAREQRLQDLLQAR